MPEQNMYGGAVEEISTGTGEVFGYCLVSMSLNDTNSLELHFKKTFSSGKSLLLKGWLNDVDAEKLTIYDGQTKETAFAKAISRVKRTIWNIVKNYADAETVKAAQSKVVDWTTLCEQAIGCLPEGYDQIPGKLVVGYKDTGFLAFPTYMQWDKNVLRYLPFFSVDANVKLRDLGKLLVDKPEQPDQIDAGEKKEEAVW